MPKYAFRVTLDHTFNFVVKDSTLSDIFEAKRITDRIEEQYKEENVQIEINEYRHGDEAEEVVDLYELENELTSRIRSVQRHNQEVLDKLETLSSLLDSVIDSHRFNIVHRRISLSLFKLDQYFYFDITIDDFSYYKITLSMQNGSESSIIRRTANEALAEITNVQDILTQIESLANKTEFDLL